MAERKRKVSRADRIGSEISGIIEQQLEEIDEALTRVNKLLAPYEELKIEANKLQAARRALLGGNRQTGAGGTRLQMEDIVRYLGENPGSTAGEIAAEFGVAQNTVSSALYRGKGERYLSKDKKWYLRDPKNGVNTEADIDNIEEEDEE